MSTLIRSETSGSSEITRDDLLTYYQELHDAYGHQGWWPSEGWFETIVGAVLAQNVSWTGASQAVSTLKKSGLLDPEALLLLGPDTLAPLIRSSRYYNQKAVRLLVFAEFFMTRYRGDISLMKQEETGLLREMLLELKGFGPETVDSILLYACEKPVFVVDAYTRRIGSRIGWFPVDASYELMQNFFTTRLFPDPDLFNDYHAQLVYLGTSICRTKPVCESCPIRQMPEDLRCPFVISDTPRVRKKP
ncbi:MAG: endonuclease III domain-containing protein [Methanospirillum sp.]|uniref:endonuclease III domain-containing protein n=1 Tax=Methanospirillum sp. TaxID=45200 RepID=UPI002370AC00|nr:endonuclease III domain-containing protein [Methanospirillum sp.]MDD1728381.1 endonuclease III domain-containing protein [Methanospirillum sp.]